MTVFHPIKIPDNISTTTNTSENKATEIQMNEILVKNE